MSQGRRKIYSKFESESYKRRDHLGELELDGKEIL
jgi:hypothetical protein